MSSKIFYKFSSQEVGPIGEVIFTGQTLRLADLKREIMDKLAQGQSEYAEFDLEITDSETHKTYADEARLVPKNATVFIRRIPVATLPSRRFPYAPGGARSTAPVAKVEKPAGGGGSDDFQDVFVARPDATRPPSGDLNITINTSTDASEQRLSKEEEAIQRMVRTSGTTSTAPGASGPSAGTAPRGFAGLAFRAQPGAGAAFPPKAKKAIGIPKEMLAAPTEGGEQGASRIQVRPDESFDQKVKTQGVKVMSEDEVRKRLKGDQSIHVPEELRCSISNELLKEAVRLPCCLRPCSFDKISNALLANGLTCPLCKQSPITVDTLKADKLLRDKVNGFLNEVRIRLEKVQEATLATNAQKARSEEVPLPSNNKSDIVLDLSSRGDKSETRAIDDGLPSEPTDPDDSIQAGAAESADQQQNDRSRETDDPGEPHESHDGAQNSGPLVTAGYSGAPIGPYGMYGRPPFIPRGVAPYGGPGGYYPPQPWMGPRGFVPRGPPFGWQTGPPGVQPWTHPRGPVFPPQAGPIPPGWQGRPPRFGGPAFRGGPRPPFAPGFRGPMHPRPTFTGAHPPSGTTPIEASELEQDNETQQKQQEQQNGTDSQDSPRVADNASHEDGPAQQNESTRRDSRAREPKRRSRSPVRGRQERRRSRNDYQSTGRRHSADRGRRPRSPSPPRRGGKESEVSRRTDERTHPSVNDRDDDRRERRGDHQDDKGGRDRRADREPPVRRGEEKDVRPSDERRGGRDRRRRSREKPDRSDGFRREEHRNRDAQREKPRDDGRGRGGREDEPRDAGRRDTGSRGPAREERSARRDERDERRDDDERQPEGARDRKDHREQKTQGTSEKEEAFKRRDDLGPDRQEAERGRRREEKSRDVHRDMNDKGRQAGRTRNTEAPAKQGNVPSEARVSARHMTAASASGDVGRELESEEDWELYEEDGDEDDDAAGSSDANKGPQGMRKRRHRGGRRRGDKKRRK